MGKVIEKKQDKQEEQKRFDEALKRVWSSPPQHKTAKKKEEKK